MQETQLNIPQHIAIIVDGNRRWAKERGLPTFEGHRKGAENVDTIINYASKIGIKCVTVWIFSTENWKRSPEEVQLIFQLARELTDKYKKKCMDEKIHFVHLGRKDRLPKDIVDNIIEMEEKTKEFTNFTVALAMDYGGQDELIRTIKKIEEKGVEVSKENIENNLDTAGLPKVDMIIRTGGDTRLSGFMLWQCEYAEFYFTKKYFPEFNENDLLDAVKDFNGRNRRFGGDPIGPVSKN